MIINIIISLLKLYNYLEKKAIFGIKYPSKLTSLVVELQLVQWLSL